MIHLVLVYYNVSKVLKRCLCSTPSLPTSHLCNFKKRGMHSILLSKGGKDTLGLLEVMKFPVFLHCILDTDVTRKCFQKLERGTTELTVRIQIRDLLPSEISQYCEPITFTGPWKPSEFLPLIWSSYHEMMKKISIWAASQRVYITLRGILTLLVSFHSQHTSWHTTEFTLGNAQSTVSLTRWI